MEIVFMILRELTGHSVIDSLGINILKVQELSRQSAICIVSWAIVVVTLITFTLIDRNLLAHLYKYVYRNRTQKTTYSRFLCDDILLIIYRNLCICSRGKLYSNCFINHIINDISLGFCLLLWTCCLGICLRNITRKGVFGGSWFLLDLSSSYNMDISIF